MVFEDKRRAATETIIGPTVKVEGNFVGSGDVIVEGQFVGSLKTDKSLRVGEGAKVKADIEAADVLLAGEIRGNVRATGSLELGPTAKLYGNVETPSLSVARGAILHGKCLMATKDAAAVEPMSVNRRAQREATG